ncbi:MAG: histidine triad nucleotide-binding protein [Chloroflexi bacterium]|nr:histidine triad nucleotide-binding protein [Chloroflexota bacterium]
MSRDPSCLFCRIVHKEHPAQILHQDDQVTAFRDSNPQAPTHLLVVPNQHIRGVAELGEEQGPLLGRMIQVANELARREGITTHGYRLVFNVGREAGQSIYHLHLHLLGGRPMRWPPG